MKPIYLVRRHRLAPKHYQGLARKRAVYNRDYEVIHVTTDVADANAKSCHAKCKRGWLRSRSRTSTRYCERTVMKKPYSREVRTKLERLQMQLDAERDRAEKPGSTCAN